MRMLYLKKLGKKISAMMKKNEDHCGCKTVYTPQGLRGLDGDPGTPGTIPETTILSHAIVAGDVITQGTTDINLIAFNSGTFRYKDLSNGMFWWELHLSLNIDATNGSGSNFRASIKRRINNLPVTFGDPLAASMSHVSIGHVWTSNPLYTEELLSVDAIISNGGDLIDLNRVSQLIPLGLANLEFRVNGTTPGVIL